MQTPTFTILPLGVTVGTYSHVFDLTDAATYNSPFRVAKWRYRGGCESGLGGRNSSRGVIPELP
jgi:hypothetical protein